MRIKTTSKSVYCCSIWYMSLAEFGVSMRAPTPSGLPLGAAQLASNGENFTVRPELS